MKLSNKQIAGGGGPSMRLGKWYVSASKETGHNRVRVNRRLVHKNWIHGNKTDKRQSPHIDWGLMEPVTVRFGDVVIRTGWRDNGHRVAYRTVNNAVKG